ncbi:AgmX/PglI C-terminal domain-containing protein [Agaribacterium haliotis]|uniref:AgmX/PglI C-terminal domain-containing protein n=1 Tax=Agaribacterium haliotis TaxID=2013869 RepID=UPI000BB53DAB|nr:AgmX/PglI C-terminal domain-containing protein [Agaribacterium haliotis]
MASFIAPPNLQLPWASSDDDNRRFKRIFLVLLVPFLVLSIAIPLIKLPEPDRKQLEKLPPQLARVQLEEKKLPPPPPPPTPEPKKEQPKPEEKPTPPPKKEEPKPESKPTPPPVKEEPPAQLVEEARQVAEAEINQFADALSDMREAFDVGDMSDDASSLTQSAGAAAEVDRSVIGAAAKAGSGGINTAKLSRDTGGKALSGKKDTKVKSELAAATGKASVAKAKPARDGSKRSEEEIRKTMDKNKGAIDAIYNRALRRNPALEGKVVFKLVIEPTGKVSSASIVSSELEDPALERKLLARVRLINFGQRSVVQTTINYSIDFLPY